MITQGLLRALDRLNNVGGSGWLEVATRLKVLPESEAFHRQLRLGVKYGWVEEGRSVQGRNWTAYRITPAGMAVHDRYAISDRIVERREPITADDQSSSPSRRQRRRRRRQHA